MPITVEETHVQRMTSRQTTDDADLDFHGVGEGARHPFCSEEMARVTGLEPATSGVTGRHSNQLSYTRVSRCVVSSAARGVV